MQESTINAGKTMAIIAYITLIGTLIAYLMNNDKKNEFASFHIGQGLRAGLASIAISIITTVLIMTTGMGILSYLSYAGWIFMILGLINAANGKFEKLPLIGDIG